MISRLSCALFCAASLLSAGIASDTQAQAAPQFSVDWHVVSAGADQLRNNCFVVTGTTGQASLGYSSGGVYALLSGFWAVAPIRGADRIFFSSFEGCMP